MASLQNSRSNLRLSKNLNYLLDNLYVAMLSAYRHEVKGKVEVGTRFQIGKSPQFHQSSSV